MVQVRIYKKCSYVGRIVRFMLPQLLAVSLLFQIVLQSHMATNQCGYPAFRKKHNFPIIYYL
jgi:hypothetical protein